MTWEKGNQHRSDKQDFNEFLLSQKGFIEEDKAQILLYKFLREKVYLYVAILLPAIGYIITAIIGNNIALSLKNKKTKTIGVIIPEVVHHFFAMVVRGVEQVAVKR